MKISDEKIRDIAKKRRGQRPRGAHPSDERMAAFLDEKLDPQEQEEIMGHITRCQACLESVKVLREISADSEQVDMIRIPLSAIEKARSLDPASKSMMEVVIKFVKGAAEVVRLSGDAVGGLVTSAEVLRGEGRVLSETLVTFAKEFTPYVAEVDVEKIKSDRGEITVKLLDREGGRSAEGVRVTLFDKDNELESAMLEDGSAVFEDLAFGKYRLEITKVGEPIGRITLEMKGEGK